jgi:SAM-dependent methyltransferase
MTREEQAAILADASRGLDLLAARERTRAARLPSHRRFIGFDEFEHLRRAFPRAFAEGGSVLDVGDGEGTFLRQLGQAGVPEPLGLEPMAPFVDVARGEGLDSYVGRLEPGDLPEELADRRFAAVCLRESLYYVNDLAEAFGMLRRMLEPGGGLYLKFHTPSSVYYRRQKDRLARYGRGVSFLPTLPVMLRVLEAEGFRVVESGYLPFNVLETLDVADASGRLALRVLGRLLSSVANLLGAGDRAYILATAPDDVAPRDPTGVQAKRMS